MVVNTDIRHTLKKGSEWNADGADVLRLLGTFVGLALLGIVGFIGFIIWDFPTDGSAVRALLFTVAVVVYSVGSTPIKESN